MDDRPPRPEDLEALLARFGAGDRAAAERLIPLLYDDLRGIAARHLARERVGHTLQPTALMHEAWIKLSGRNDLDLPSREHFLALASCAMRTLLVDHARRKRTEKRGGTVERVALEEAMEGAKTGDAMDVLAVDEALRRLEAVDPERARLVELRFFSGATVAEAAAAVGLPVRTAERRLQSALAWFRRELDGLDPESERP